MKLPVTLNEPPNIFDAEMVHRDLETHKDLWQKAFYINEQVGIFGQPDCEVYAINYYLVAVAGMEERLVQLTLGWKPGKLEWQDHSNAKFNPPADSPLHKNGNVLKVTWVI